MIGQKKFDISAITKELLEEIAIGRHVFDCPKITLTQLSKSNPIIFNGRGMILLENAPVFKLRMYADPVDDTDVMHSVFDALKKMQNLNSGEAIPEDDFFPDRGSRSGWLPMDGRENPNSRISKW